MRLRAGGYEKAQKITVSEAGASVYSASATASEELPELDVTLRGAVSIARRLQDPLAELVKIDPQSIGVGQYQHDVSVTALRRGLDATVEDCVNAVGVNLNSASVPLLARVAGLNRTVAENIVAYRNENGPFTSRTELLNVPRLGPKAYEQAAGFVRITGGVEPLDASAVHPESYPIARRIIADALARNGAVWAAGALTVPGTSENEKALMGLRPADYITFNDGNSIPQLGYGVWQIEDNGAADAVGTALETGYRHIDTASIYGNEVGVGRGIATSSVPREDIFLTTKLWNSDQGFEKAISALDASLERLGTDYVDLYLIHWAKPQQGTYLESVAGAH